jgi:hypothetical protein
MVTAPTKRALLVALAGAAVALVPAVALRGFTVDDALIPARYAFHLATGAGYRFDADGPVTDGVTALGWAPLLAPFARGGPLAALRAAKLLGLVAWTLASALLAHAVDRASTRPARFAALALVAVSAPLAAWSVAGLETGVVTALSAAAVAARSLGRDRAGTACAAIAAGLRPELFPWALVVAAAPGPGEARPAWKASGTRVLLAATPFVIVALVREVVFGRAAPLAQLAKPADVALGARYALACFLLTGPVVLLAPFAFRRLAPWPRALVLAVFAHFVAIGLAGGDWMPLSRLAVPALPTVVLAAAYLLSVEPERRIASLATAARLGAVLCAEAWVLATVGPSAARVGADRLAVIDQLSPALRTAHVVAALDVGWVGAATDATIVDLAGVTDPAIAALPGGHTTKRVPPALLEARHVDTLVLLLEDGQSLRIPWTESRFARGVERRLAALPGAETELEPVAVSDRGRLRYVVLRRRAPGLALAGRASRPVFSAQRD